MSDKALESTKDILEDVQTEDAKKLLKFLAHHLGDENVEELKKLPKELKKQAQDKVTQKIAGSAKGYLDKALDIFTKRESTMSEYDNTELLEKEAETPTLDTKSEEDPKLYQDAEGGHAKIDTDQGTEGKAAKSPAPN